MTGIQRMQLTIAGLRQGLEIEREEKAQLRKALERMDKMHALMMEKVNHNESWYDAECLREMNEAPLEARRALDAIP